MSGVVTGQVFTEKELDRLLEWHALLSSSRSIRTVAEDDALADKIRNDYLSAVACRVESR